MTKSQKIIDKQRKYIFDAVKNYYEEPIVVSNAKGSIVKDLDGKSYSVSHKLSIIYLLVWLKVKYQIFKDGTDLPRHNWFLLMEGNRLTGYS